ncbi:MAG: hypothetical protein HFH96_10010 [Lachnospiraceae bacterium]|nr:DUF5702 domain-containing protein [uncultured Acetatifactor sp.]MCI9231424.1 hypothetical protein [Lachnospiraceae bacterium]
MKNLGCICRKVYDRDNAGQSHNAYLTVTLALCLAVILSLFLTLIDGVRRNGARLEVECVTDIGLQSIMAEYHRELMKQYNLFAIDSSYGTGTCGRANTEAHLLQYLSGNLSYDDIFLSDYLYRDFLGLTVEQAELTKVSILTDYSGAVFRGDAVKAVKADVGLGLLEELQGWMQKVEVNGLEEGKEEARKQELDAEIREWIDEYDGTEIEVGEDEWGRVEIRNPTDELEATKRLGLLRLVVGDAASVSTNIIHTDGLILNRMQQGRINHGNIALEENAGAGQMTERFLFQEYLLRYMGRYGEEHEEDALHYQIEYLIGGKESDVENLKSVVNRLCILREAANAMYLMSNEAKKAEIKLVAAAACTLIALPALTPLLESAILLAWAYAESVYDVRSLLAGGKVPLLKDDGSWHYSLTAALSGSLQDEGTGGEGLGYEDYLRIFMMLSDMDTITARAMDMVEADIRKTPGNAGFRLDGCFRTVEARVRIGSSHGYRCEITRQKRYE